VRVDPDDPEPVVSGCEPLDRTDVRAAATAQNERALGQLGSEGEDLIASVSSATTAASGIREMGESGLRHRLAALAPGARHANEPGGELPAAGMALVLGPIATAVSVRQSGHFARRRDMAEGYRCFSYTSACQATRMPTLS
jgi:hypothetical protein